MIVISNARHAQRRLEEEQLVHREGLLPSGIQRLLLSIRLELLVPVKDEAVRIRKAVTKERKKGDESHAPSTRIGRRCLSIAARFRALMTDRLMCLGTTSEEVPGMGVDTAMGADMATSEPSLLCMRDSRLDKCFFRSRILFFRSMAGTAVLDCKDTHDQSVRKESCNGQNGFVQRLK